MTIRNIMNSPHPLKKGHVQLHRLGDDAAVDIMKILATRDRPVTKNELLTIFDMLRIAYEKPVAIVTPSNRAPKATLFILKAVDQSTADQDLKKQIADLTKQFTALGSSKP